MTGPGPKGEASRRDIIAAASRVFAQRGYTETRMDDIVRATGRTKGALYFHFRSKEELARAVVEDHKRTWLVLGREEVARHASPLAQVRGLGRLLGRLAAEEDASWSVVRLAAQIRGGGPDDDGPLRAWVDLVAEIIVRGQDAGEIREELSADDAALILVSAFDGLKSTTEAIGSVGADAFERQAGLMVDLLLAGMVTP
ncbi:TetR/AcrR family transcriptional regulator [Arachnia propionica]|uniref:TetR/AcrR family transcriptional regulator n=1 Tax=Arachnia propionica TaxID=1750 RepID=A0A3P1T4Q5_9ACTN|nr:TetR/AcrR family transcriptional regulator [Arachnia propionica]MDO5083870.1 helix-turn-helix domain-containing protein [Arachnia propionica]RRD04461.1 TetR/AcrR family transcriptional regulator [Arachnia propionica]